MTRFDPRMRGFRSRHEVSEVDALLGTVTVLPSEMIPSIEGNGRVLAATVPAPIDLPGFDRSAMDGYAVVASDTFGATAYSPLSLRVIGESLAGHGFDGAIEAGQAVRIMTGAPVPPGADAVLRAEDTRTSEGDDSRVEVVAPVSPGKNVANRGEDVEAGAQLLPGGRRLRPQDLGILTMAGVPEVAAVRRPQIDVLITGDEVLPVGSVPTPPKVVDANSPMLAALVARDGGVVRTHPIVRDDYDVALDAVRAATGDVLLISGGTSVGAEDHMPGVVAELGELLVHGVAMRPSSPMGVGRLGDRWVFLLPGNPVSCLCAYDFFAGPLIRALGGRSRDWPYRRVERTLVRKLTSVAGRVDYARVRLVPEGGVEPRLVSGASRLSSATSADGFVIVPHGAEGIEAGERVSVFLYDDVPPTDSASQA